MALNSGFFDRLPDLHEVSSDEADIAWLVYDLVLDPSQNIYNLQLQRVSFTLFGPVLDQISISEPGPVEDFLDVLQEKLDEKLENGENPPDAPTLADLL